MKRTARDNRERYSNIAKPVQKVELSEKKPKARLIAVIALAVVGATLLSYAFVNFLNKEEGWSEITANSSSGLSCSEEFVFSYDISGDVDNKQIKALYTEACIKAYELFTADTESENYKNVAYINAHPNEKIKVDEVLYKAFEKISESGDRAIYLGPVYDYYDNVFYCVDDSQLTDYDGYLNEELAGEYSQIAAYARDKNAVDIQLLGDNTIMLFVSEEYKQYMAAQESETYIDFYWMKNAFIADYIAETFIEKGYTKGFLASKDGFTRAFSAEEDKSDGYVYKMYHLDKNTIYGAGSFSYNSQMSIVTYKTYGINDSDADRFYDTKDDRTLTKYLSVEDGVNRASLSELVVVSPEKSCADILLETKDYFISDSFDENGINGLSAQKIYAIYFKEHKAYYNYSDIEFFDMYKKEDISFETSYIN